MRKLKGVLLIDDNETSNFLNHRLLNRMEVTENIRVFSNGLNALEYLQKIEKGNFNSADPNYFKPELIFLDVNMPMLDGFEFLEMYHNDLADKVKQDTVIALLSTSSHPQDTVRASEYAAPYILKPLTVEKVRDLIAERFNDLES
ncbi:two-component system-response regulator, receiver domain protein [Adhaeribacter arboris]|uniref:Two-component system-response regulator, receiver domain protein n=1 Tax=Adhaeribacter arboris TaxID=2072846 RepID=A0A2T2YGK5_9BACT|nr:response regulator [Adhaeribacter arboris]PSR54633.1 two-component system-response regulator, receiver domain protein [Adhaeribacter arboris]